MKLSPVRWLGRGRERQESDSGLFKNNNHNLVKFAAEEAYFLLWAGDFSPASPSSSAWTCRSWSPQRYQACRPWFKIWEIAMRHRSNCDLNTEMLHKKHRRLKCGALYGTLCKSFSQIKARWARVSVEGRCLTPSTARNTYTQKAFEGKTRQQCVCVCAGGGQNVYV